MIFFLWSKPLGYYRGMSAKHLRSSTRSNRVTTGIFYVCILQALSPYTLTILLLYNNTALGFTGFFFFLL